MNVAAVPVATVEESPTTEPAPVPVMVVPLNAPADATDAAVSAPPKLPVEAPLTAPVTSSVLLKLPVVALNAPLVSVEANEPAPAAVNDVVPVPLLDFSVRSWAVVAIAFPAVMDTAPCVVVAVIVDPAVYAKFSDAAGPVGPTGPMPPTVAFASQAIEHAIGADRFITKLPASLFVTNTTTDPVLVVMIGTLTSSQYDVFPNAGDSVTVEVVDVPSNVTMPPNPAPAAAEWNKPAVSTVTYQLLLASVDLIGGTVIPPLPRYP